MITHHIHLSIASLLCATLLSTASPLAAAETRAVNVQSGDLNLAKEAGRAALQQRIAHAIDAVCGSAHARTTADIEAYATCSKTARAGAEAQYKAVVAKSMSETKVAADRKASTPVD